MAEEEVQPAVPKAKAMKKGKGKAMKKGKGKGKAKAKPVVTDENGQIIPVAKKAPKLSTRKRVLEEIGDMPLQQALNQYKQKKVEAEKAVETAVKKEAELVKEAERLKQAADKAGASVEAQLEKNKDKRTKNTEAHMKLLEIDKELQVLKKAETLAQMEVKMLEEEGEGEEKRKALRAAMEQRKASMAEAKAATAKMKEEAKVEKEREKEAAKKAREEELEAKRQAKDMQELAKEKEKEHKRQEAEEKKRKKQEEKAIHSKSAIKAPKRVKIVAGEDVD